VRSASGSARMSGRISMFRIMSIRPAAQGRADPNPAVG
jgi:hypothetical protein